MRSVSGSPHLDEELAERFLGCQATRRENRTVVLHLLRGCQECNAKLQRRWRPAPDADYEAALTQLMEAWAKRAKAAWGQVVPFRRKGGVAPTGKAEND
jgi:hypothetical protein